MILTDQEASSIVEARHRSPHELLGMHQFGDGSGTVTRVFWPGGGRSGGCAVVHEKNKPRLTLQQVRPGLFEGSTTKAKRVYAYDVMVTGADGKKFQLRDAYSFLPTLGETDLYLFAQGNERRIYEKLGAQLRTIDGVAGTSFAVWAPSRCRCVVSVSSGRFQ